MQFGVGQVPINLWKKAYHAAVLTEGWHEQVRKMVAFGLVGKHFVKEQVDVFGAYHLLLVGIVSNSRGRICLGLISCRGNVLNFIALVCASFVFIASCSFHNLPRLSQPSFCCY